MHTRTSPSRIDEAKREIVGGARRLDANPRCNDYGGDAELAICVAKPGLESPTDTTDYTAATATVNLTVNKATPTVALTSSLNPSTVGASVTFTATLTYSGPAPGAGITFLDGTTALGTVTPSGGVAKFTTTALTGGSHSITASFLGGGPDYNPAKSSVLTQTVK